MTDRELMQQALEALDDVLQLSAEHAKVRSALRERLAQPEQSRAERMRDAGYTRRPTLREISSKDEQPEQEPVAWMWVDDPWGANQYHFSVEKEDGWSDRWTPLYTTPPRREWVGLTDEEIRKLCDENFIAFGAYAVDFISAIEAKLKEKNA